MWPGPRREQPGGGRDQAVAPTFFGGVGWVVASQLRCNKWAFLFLLCCSSSPLASLPPLFCLCSFLFPSFFLSLFKSLPPPAVLLSSRYGAPPFFPLQVEEADCAVGTVQRVPATVNLASVPSWIWIHLHVQDIIRWWSVERVHDTPGGERRKAGGWGGEPRWKRWK